MKNLIKKHAMALAALAIAASYGLMSFGISDISAEKVDDLHWFTVEEDGSGYKYSDSNQPGGSPSPAAGCQSEDETILCAVAFPTSELDVNNMPSETNPENAEPQNKRFQDEP